MKDDDHLLMNSSANIPAVRLTAQQDIKYVSYIHMYIYVLLCPRVFVSLCVVYVLSVCTVCRYSAKHNQIIAEAKLHITDNTEVNWWKRSEQKEKKDADEDLGVDDMVAQAYNPMFSVPEAKSKPSADSDNLMLGNGKNTLYNPPY